jgi:hypothetical protein
VSAPLIDGGEFMHGRFIEDQVQGEAFVELQRVFLAWKRPEPQWPAGTTFTEPRKERQWSSLTSWAILPGVRYELLLDHLRHDEPDPREVPPVLWSLIASPAGEVFAHPRIAQMSVTFDLEHHPVSEDRKLAAYAGVPLGLERRYRIGRLYRALHEETRVVSEGWRFT